MSTTVVVLLAMSVSTATAEQLLIIMRRHGDNVRLSGLAHAHVHNDKTLNEECFIHHFSHLAIIFRQNEGEGSN